MDVGDRQGFKRCLSFQLGSILSVAKLGQRNWKMAVPDNWLCLGDQQILSDSRISFNMPSDVGRGIWIHFSSCKQIS